MPMHHIDLNTLESFSFLFKNIWSPDPSKRAKINIVDTILFKDGLPYLWLFTSDKTGDIMKKKSDRLDSVSDIVKAIKNRSRALKGLKDIRVRNKIATIWYMESGQRVASYLVDELELSSIMHNHLTEILCIQVYMGSYYLKGNGIFEHRMWTEQNGTMKHITYEQVDPVGAAPQSSFTNIGEKLVVSERQHSIMTAMSKYLNKHIRMMTGAKVGGMIFQVVFSSSWVPYVVSCRKIKLEEASDMFVYKREAMVYPTGEMPCLPNFNPKSLMLPMSWTEYSPAKLLTAEQKRKIQEDERILHQLREDQRHEIQHRKKAVVLSSGHIEEPVPQHVVSDQVVATSSPKRAFPPPLSSKISNLTIDSASQEAAVTYIGDVSPKQNELIESKRPTANVVSNCKAPEITAQQPLTQRPSRLSHRNQSSFSQQGRASSRHNSRSYNRHRDSASIGYATAYSKVEIIRDDGEHVEYLIPHPDMSKGPSLTDLARDTTTLGEVDAAPFTENQGRAAVRRKPKNETAELDRLEKDQRRKEQQLLYRPESAKTIATLRSLIGRSGHSLENRMHSAFALIKDLQANGEIDRADTEDEDDTPEEEDTAFSTALPVNEFGSPSKYLSGRTVTFNPQGAQPKESRQAQLPPRYEERTESSELRVSSYAHQLYNPESFPGVEESSVRDNQMQYQQQLAAARQTSGLSFIPAELLPPAEDDPLPVSHPPARGFAFQKAMAGHAKQCFGVYCSFGKRAKNAAVGASQEPSKAATACKECTHQLTYKSILLAKAEVDFLGCDLDDNIESLVDQIQLSEVTSDQLQTYLIRRHLNRVAQRCQEEARRVSHGFSDQPFSLLKDLNVVYRRLVYSEALAKVHPSRFYYTVPLCSMCYKIYTYLDDQRELIVLHSLDSHQQVVAAAANAEAALSARRQILRAESKRPGKNPIEFKQQKDWQRKQLQSNQLSNSNSQPLRFEKTRPVSEHGRPRQHLQAEREVTASSSNRRPHSAGAISRRNPTPFTQQLRKRVAGTEQQQADDAYSTTDTIQQQQQQQEQDHRKRMPRNVHDDSILDRTSDSGIGSRGPIRLISEHHRKNGKVTISSWAKMLSQQGDSKAHSGIAQFAVQGTTEQYESTGNTMFNWDTQAEPTYLNATRSSKSTRFNSAGVHTTGSTKPFSEPSNSSTVRTLQGTRPRSASSTVRSTRFSTAPANSSGSVSDQQQQEQELEKARPKSADALSRSKSTNIGNGGNSSPTQKKSRPARSIRAALEQEAQVDQLIDAFSQHVADTALTSNIQSDEVAAAYGYSSMPFMTAPLFPASEEAAAEMPYNTGFYIGSSQHQMHQPPQHQHIDSRSNYRIGTKKQRIAPNTSPVIIRSGYQDRSNQPSDQQSLGMKHNTINADLSALMEGSKEESQYSLNANSSPGTTSIPVTVAEVIDHSLPRPSGYTHSADTSAERLIQTQLEVASDQNEYETGGGATLRRDESQESMSSMIPMNMTRVLSSGSVLPFPIEESDPQADDEENMGGGSPNSLSPMIAAGAGGLSPVPSDTELHNPPYDIDVREDFSSGYSPSSTAPMGPPSLSPFQVVAPSPIQH